MLADLIPFSRQASGVLGTLVMATDPETGETGLKEVVQLFRNETDEWIHLTVNDEEIVCTPEHPFYSPVKGWIVACRLRAGDILVTVNGEYVILEKIQHELLEAERAEEEASKVATTKYPRYTALSIRGSGRTDTRKTVPCSITTTSVPTKRQIPTNS